ncbi:hypothetical protein [Metabacillus fastidiosus]|uniref:hypothetical protein n=1 Tax=Metabacillus fastidiosus TaxID=1458 RepID=UPI002E1CF67E|nr:hypothetical protein [Metabacillus fastidiosus]
MKSSTREIIEALPILEGKINAHENLFLTEQALDGLNEVEATFLKLAWFFEDPKNVSFSIELLYQNLENEWLELALELIFHFFKKDTYLIKKSHVSIVKEDDEGYFNQKQFSDYLAENGLDYDRHKLCMYYKRGVLPPYAFKLAGKPYWNKESVESYCENEKDKSKKESIIYDEGQIGQFATEEEQQSLKDFASQMYKISKSHQKK